MRPGTEVSFVDGMDFGKGVNTLELFVRGKGVNDANGAPPSPVSGGAGDTIVFQLLRTESVEDYYSAFNLDTSVSAVMGLFGGNATFKFADSQKFHSFSQFLVVSITVTKAFVQIPNPQLDPASDAGTLLANGNKERFAQEFGDMFVLGARMGGAYYAVLEFTTQSEEDAKNLSITLDGGEFGVFATSDKFSHSISSYKGKSALRVHSFQTGGSQAAQETNIDAIIEKAKNFATELGDKGVPFLAQVQDYQSLRLPQAPNFVDVQAAADVLANYASMRNQLIKAINEVEYIQFHPDQFVDAAKLDLQGMLTQLTTALNNLRANASACVNDIQNCKFASVTIPTLSLPHRVPGTASSGDGKFSLFLGSWTNDGPGALTRLTIFGSADHAGIEGLLDVPLDLTTQAFFNAGPPSSLVAFLQTEPGKILPGNPGKALLAQGHNLTIQLVDDAGTKLQVEDGVGAEVGPPNETHVFTFSKVLGS